MKILKVFLPCIPLVVATVLAMMWGDHLAFWLGTLVGAIVAGYTRWKLTT